MTRPQHAPVNVFALLQTSALSRSVRQHLTGIGLNPLQFLRSYILTYFNCDHRWGVIVQDLSERPPSCNRENCL